MRQRYGFEYFPLYSILIGTSGYLEDQIKGSRLEYAYETGRSEDIEPDCSVVSKDGFMFWLMRSRKKGRISVPASVF